MKNFVSVLGLLVASSLVVGCAETGVGRAETVYASRGSIVTRGRTVKAIALGPRVIHAFAGQAGGDLFIAPAITGSDSDCEAFSTDDSRRSVRMVADQRAVLSLESGEIACLATSKAKSFELLWHATGEGRPLVQVAVSTKAR